jgi:hypothetical protein
VPRLRRVTAKNNLVSINQLNYNAPEKSHATEESVCYRDELYSSSPSTSSWRVHGKA